MRLPREDPQEPEDVFVEGTTYLGTWYELQVPHPPAHRQIHELFHEVRELSQQTFSEAPYHRGGSALPVMPGERYHFSMAGGLRDDPGGGRIRVDCRMLTAR
ncbi:hypothetical protein QMK19_34855 [Streptomyces sp. H10-C2]|uniref:hypothetical protein n=1 Tax=unclassified Streptomyces TaxID=2593676 RepID=UPI0024B93A43|nr:MULTISPECIES: hypothetical protein [unclassified Streptomyces]MDJ0345775.1 hypothetical protein [Streptomyces sp. PH10-H1]MDJ0374665.1 hypothetical protein [Streptomyces sp. H10-C2]